jgi:nitroreductase
MHEGNMPVNAALKSYLETRRSTPAFQMTEPGPSRDEIMELLTIASRVPDHGKLAPWRFIVYSGAERERLSAELAKVAMARNPAMTEDMIKVEKTRLTRAPVVIGVISCAKPHAKIPEWEQVLSAGAVCLNLSMAAHALGYASNWLSEWFAFDESVFPLLGVKPGSVLPGSFTSAPRRCIPASGSGRSWRIWSPFQESECHVL